MARISNTLKGDIIVGRSYVLNIKMLKNSSAFLQLGLYDRFISDLFTCEESVEGRVGRTTFSARFCPNIGAESVVEGMMALPAHGHMKKNNKTLDVISSR
jgi:hypothetical protein